MNTPEKIRDHMLKAHLLAYQQGICHPLVYKFDGKIAGITRLHSMNLKKKCLEVGGTWVAQGHKRTVVNTTVKYLLLKYCFEQLDLIRIELRVDAENYVSQMAVLRIGASFEGRLRSQYQRSDGVVRDSYLYSITKQDWPLVENNLLELLEEKDKSKKIIPEHIETKLLSLRHLNLKDALGLLHLVGKNKAVLLDSFPLQANMTQLEHAQAFIASKAYKKSEQREFVYGIWLKSTSEMIGQLQIKNIDWAVGSVELGYFIDQLNQRQGYAKEALNVVIQYLKNENKFNRIFVRIIPTNKASLNLARSQNFREEGMHRACFKKGDGAISDLTILALH